MGNQQETNPKIASLALQRLRDASEQIPAENEREGLGGILRKVKDANEEISKCEKSYQEQAEILNKTIAHSISNLVDKELVEMEDVLKNPLQCNPMDDESVKGTYQRLLRMKEKLLDLYDLVSKWGWSHLRQVQRERIAEVYENVNSVAQKTGKVLEEMAVHCPDPEKNRLMQFHDLFEAVVEKGSDRIIPDEIFAGS